MSDELTSATVSNVRALRLARGWTAAQLAERMADAGIPWTRLVVTKLENRQRDVLGIHELAALGAIFGVEPWSLAAPPSCSTCLGAPPDGFRCLTCGEPR
jgi:transcriptional regulator with XRE-family HTH domain